MISPFEVHIFTSDLTEYIRLSSEACFMFGVDLERIRGSRRLIWDGGYLIFHFVGIMRCIESDALNSCTQDFYACFGNVCSQNEIRR